MANFDNSVPIVNLPFYYVNGMGIFNDATTPNTKLDVNAGICRDSTNTYDMNLGNFAGMISSTNPNVVTVLNAANNGINGLDTGSLAASTLYQVFVVSDPVNGNPTGVMLSTNAAGTGPLMPYNYSAFRHIGFAVTDASSHFLLFWQSGSNNAREFIYDAPQATSVTAGAATTYTAVDLTKFVPLPVANQNIPVYVAFSFTPGAASRTLKLQNVNGTGDQVTITGQVTSVVVSDNVMVMAGLASSKPEISYKVSNAGDAVALNVAGFKFYI